MMSALLLYSLKSAFVLTLLYLPYAWLLRKDSFFRTNRFTLLAILVLSLVLPLCNIPSLAGEESAVTRVLHLQMEKVGTPVVETMKMTGPQVSVEREAETAFVAQDEDAVAWSWYTWLGLICGMGILVALLFRLWQFGRMYMLMRSCCMWKNREDGFVIYCHADDVTPCSWMHHVVISHKDYDDENHRHCILLHEQGHVVNHHSYDVLLLMVVQLVQWWNPVAYLLGTSLREVHEYEADRYALGQGVTQQEYQCVLIRKAVGLGAYAYTNQFNNNLIKLRIMMMNKKKSNPWMRSKVLYIIPLALLTLSAFATPQKEEVAQNGNSGIKKTHQTSKKAKANFELNIRVTEGIGDSGYLINLWDEHQYRKQVGEISVKDRKSFYSQYLDKPYLADVVATFPDGSVCTHCMRFPFVPGEKAQLEVRNGSFYLSGTGFYGEWIKADELVENARKYHTAEETQQMLTNYLKEHGNEEGCAMYFIIRSSHMGASQLSPDILRQYIPKSIINGRFKDIIHMYLYL